jgi:hypothetical protein
MSPPIELANQADERFMGGNDNYNSFSGDSYFSRLFLGVIGPFFWLFLGWFSAFAGAWGFTPQWQMTREAPVRAEPHPPMVCVKLPKSVLGLFHLFSATKLPLFQD